MYEVVYPDREREGGEERETFVTKEGSRRWSNTVHVDPFQELTTRVSDVDLPDLKSCFGHLGARSLTRAVLVAPTPPSEEGKKRPNRTNPEEGAV